MYSALDKVSSLTLSVSKVQLFLAERDSKPTQKERPLKSTSGFPHASQISGVEAGRDKNQREEMDPNRGEGEESRPHLPLSSSSSSLSSKESGTGQDEEAVAVKIGEQDRKQEAIGIKDRSIGGDGGGGDHDDDGDDGYHTPKSPRFRIPAPVVCPPAPKKPPPLPRTARRTGRVRRRLEFETVVGLVLHQELDDVFPSVKKAREEAALVE